VSVDVQEIDGASHTSVENIREINENIKYPPVGSPFKIIIIDEVHMISVNAFNALLKTLEEPPPHAKFIFATTESHKVPATINSRCQRFNFRTISLKEMCDGMARILVQEEVEASPEALAMVAREAQGSFRDALSLLDQVIAFGSGRVAESDVAEILGIAGRDAFGGLAAAVFARDAATALSIVHHLFEQGYDPDQFVMDLIHYMRNLIVVKAMPARARPEGMVDASPGETEELERLAGGASAEELHYLFQMLLRAEGEVKRAGNPWTALEMAVLKLANAPDIVSLSEIVRRIDSEGPRTAAPAPRRPSLRIAEPPPVGETAQRPVKAKELPGRVQQSPEPQAKREAGEQGGGAGIESATAGNTRGFTITGIASAPDGQPDDIWAMIRREILDSVADQGLCSIMEHGRIISISPLEVEIGFHKPIYRQTFLSKLEEKPEVRKIFDDYFNGARLNILVLAEPTSLAAEKPYPNHQDGQSDRNRALKQEAMEHPIVRAIKKEFSDSSIEEIRILQ
jgi:DNA polymerase-3 subunit gamma/tau